MISLIVIVAQLSTAQLEAAKTTYHQLPPADVEAKKLDAPPADAKRIDVSGKIRSTSFGHKTWLLVAPDGTRFWVEWSKSTNRPGALFGPFAIAAGDGGANPPPATPSTETPAKPGPGAGKPGTGKMGPTPAPPPEGDGIKRAPPLPKS